MKYRKKPVVVDVVKWDGSNLSKNRGIPWQMFFRLRSVI